MKEVEVWKDIKGYDGMYKISNLGNIKSLKSGKEQILKPSPDGSGYLKINLYLNGHRKQINIHQLVAMAFLNHTICGKKLVVNHKDFNRLNNHLDNLEIVTMRENSNRKHFKSSSKYTGVGWHKATGKWASYIVTKRKQTHLGVFESEYEAHLAYQKALSELK